MTNIAYTFRPTRGRKTIRLVIQPDGTLVVRASPWMPKAVINAFIAKKASWINKHLQAIREGNHPKPLQGPAREFQMLRATAYAYAKERLNEIVAHYGCTYTHLTIRNTKTRWGSCSRRGRISIHYKLVFLTPELADYLLIHEVCHLKEMNHSARFWKLVSEQAPEWRRLRHELHHWTRGHREEA